MRLLHAFLACTDEWSHDRDTVVFERADGMTLEISMDLAVVSFGPKGASDRHWTENVDSGFMQKALTYFIYGVKDKSYDDMLKKLDWIG